MKELLEIIAKALVQYPEDVVINEEEREGEKHLCLTVNEQDMGKIIGKSGRIARAIRSVMAAASSKHGEKVTVDIRDLEEKD